MTYCKFHSFMGSQNEAHECKDCGLKVNPPRLKRMEWEKRFEELQLSTRNRNNFERDEYIKDFIRTEIESAKAEKVREVVERIEGMRRGACCDCKPEKGYKCYHAGREDVLGDLKQKITHD